MSTLTSTNNNHSSIRWKLLTGASAAAIMAYASSIGIARAEDSDRPLLWLEFSGNTEMMQGTAGSFSVPFFNYPTATLDTLLSNSVNVVGDQTVYGKNSFAQKLAPSRFAFGGDAKLTFQPENSDWIFSADVRYGRSHSNKHTHYQGPQAFRSGINKYAAAFSDTLSHQSERHLIADFQAGRDVGLGLFGPNGTSTLSAGVRFAQFSNKSSAHVSARPFVSITQFQPAFNQYFFKGHQARSFNGVGPSIAWNASAALAGNKEHGELTLDWGVNGALLFGRQKTKTDHATSAYHAKYGSFTSLYAPRNISAPLRSRRVTVPDVSGFIGLSARLPHSKVTIGYKGEIWFGAVDRGIDVRKTTDTTFNGPYASISIGLGD